jgi:hypothetical protein
MNKIRYAIAESDFDNPDVIWILSALIVLCLKAIASR